MRSRGVVTYATTRRLVHQCGPLNFRLASYMTDAMTSFCGVGSSRQRQIRATTDAPVTSCPDLLGGRLLVYFPDADLCDGAAQAESDGFFDVYNVPPWDAWVGYFEDSLDRSRSYDSYLIAYVPEKILTLATDGILVNPEACIMWLSDSDVKLRPRFATPR